MVSGIDKRLSSIFSPVDNRALCIACDHGLMTDPYRSWLQIDQVVNGAVEAKADGMLLSSGQICRFVAVYGRGCMPSFIVRTDWTNLLRFTEKPGDRSKLLPVARFEYRRLMNARDVLYRYGGAASIGFLFVDADGITEAQTIRSSRELIEESHEIGLPCIIEVLPLGGGSAAATAELLRRGVAKALEMGADAIKMPLTDEIESLCSTIHQAGKRLFVLGGGNLADEDLFVSLMQQALASGVDGLLVGRNVSNSPDPARLIFKLHSVVHPLEK
jgi:DhnA family fructose-bisphosphate aldolase class Ia